MSFMFNPHPYDDTTAINRPKLSEETVNSIISGTRETAAHLSKVLSERISKTGKNQVLALDGYISAEWQQTVNLVSQSLLQRGISVTAISFADVYKSADQLDSELDYYLAEDREKDPVLLYGKLFKKGYEELLCGTKLQQLKQGLEAIKATDAGEVTIIYGNGCAISALRNYYDILCFFDVTPKETILRGKKGCFANIGDTVAKPVKALLRRCYYIDFEAAGHLRWELLKNDAIDFYVVSNDPEDLKLVPRDAFKAITGALVKYPFRCKPVYIEGIWGGQYIKRMRNLPDTMLNCAWVFDLIPLEVSIVVEAGKNLLEMPYFTFVQKEGQQLMGEECVKTFGGYFPIRFNYDDSYHSSGNMSIQVHSGHDYNVENYAEHGRQDESYYVLTTGHGAKTYIGFNDGADADEFMREVKKSEKEFTPVDYQKYVNHVESKPGVQVMIPAGTIHSSGRNQVVLEIGSLSIGSYTYKLYDYLRADLDGIPRPIHTYHGENVLCKERTASWVKENLVQEPQMVRSGDGWAEYIVGQHDLLYFSLRRLEFEDSIEDDTKGRFHVLNLIDGEKTVIQSIDNPELCFTQNYLDMVVVPANMGRYVVKNMGNQPVTVHKTMLKDGFANEKLFVD